jgi:hypothetical protein
LSIYLSMYLITLKVKKYSRLSHRLFPEILEVR